MRQETYKIGDYIPIESTERLQTFYLIRLENYKYLVDATGRVFLVAPEISATDMAGMDIGQADFHPEETAGAEPVAAPPRLRFEPGTPEYTLTESLVDHFMESFLFKLKKDFPILMSRTQAVFSDRRKALQKYLQVEYGGLAGLKAYLIRELFANTTYAERGLDILEFLSRVIAVDMDGVGSAPGGEIPDEQHRELMIRFFSFIRNMGSHESQKRIFEETFSSFQNADFDLLMKGGGIGYYISTSYSNALKNQMDFLMNEKNRNYLQDYYRKAIRTKREMMVSNPCAFLKAIVILKLIANSTKEQRGRTEEEREQLFQKIIAYEYIKT